MDIGHGIDTAHLMTQATTPGRIPRSGEQRNQEKIRELAQEFEAIFIQQMYKEMRKSIPDDGLLQRTNAEDMYTQMQDLEAARMTARQGGIGLAEMMLKQLQRID